MFLVLHPLAIEPWFAAFHPPHSMSRPMPISLYVTIPAPSRPYTLTSSPSPSASASSRSSGSPPPSPGVYIPVHRRHASLSPSPSRQSPSEPPSPCKHRRLRCVDSKLKYELSCRSQVPACLSRNCTPPLLFAALDPAIGCARHARGTLCLGRASGAEEQN